MDHRLSPGRRAVLRVYSETLPFEELLRPQTLGLLARYELELVLAVRPWDLEALPPVARALRHAGIPLSIWPMLADDDGRWASVGNAAAFGRLVHATCDALALGAPDRADALAQDVLFDLEPPIAKARGLASIGDPHRERHLRGPDGLARLVSGFGRRPDPGFTAASALLARTASELVDRGLTTSTAVWPLVALDPPGRQPWQALLGTPVDGLATADVSHVSVMMYTSMLEGWSRGALRRRDVTGLLGAATARTLKRWGARGGVSLGCVGTGAFEDEPVYRDPGELAEDVTVARGAGCTRLSLFDLGGVLSRSPPEAWLEAFVHGAAPSSSRPPRRPSNRVHAARLALRAATWMLGRPELGRRLC